MAPRDRWRRRWLSIVIAAASAVTVLDAALLERKRAFFSGGFLAVDYVRSWAEGAWFILGSVISDVAVIAVPAAVVIWLVRRFGLPVWLGLVGAFAAGAGPLLLADAVGYQILSFLGDAFDFGLMFDLVGHNPKEILAVSGDHLAAWLTVAAVLLLVAAACFWWLARLARRRREFAERTSFLRWSVQPLLCLLIGGTLVASMRASSAVLDNGLRRKPSGQFIGTLVSLATDIDRDGFGLLDRPADPDIFDSAIHPWAIDVPGNGIDEDGVDGDLPVSESASDGASELATTTPFGSTPDVILIMLETMRADALGSHLDGQPVAPVLDALAARGVSSTRAYSHNGYTAQSRHSLFSGSLLPTGGASGLIDDFNKNGYETAYFSGQDESFGGAALGSGFERAAVHYDARQDVDRRYTSYTTPGSLGVSHRVLNERIHDFLGRRDRQRPLFLYVNFYDLHFPYYHRELDSILKAPVIGQFDISPSNADAVHQMYLNSVANVDRAIGVLIDSVRGSTGREPAVMILADHGESLFDEGFLGHGYALNDIQTRIPLIAVNLPVEIVEPFGQADVRSTLTRALEGVPGRAAPTIRQDPDRHLFQYLGLIERPVQIGFTTTTGRTIYDFRLNRVRFGEGPWKRAEECTPDERVRFDDLIHTWERMILRMS